MQIALFSSIFDGVGDMIEAGYLESHLLYDFVTFCCIVHIIVLIRLEFQVSKDFEV